MLRNTSRRTESNALDVLAKRRTLIHTTPNFLKYRILFLVTMIVRDLEKHYDFIESDIFQKNNNRLSVDLGKFWSPSWAQA